MTAALQLDLLKGKRQRGVRPPDASEFACHCLIVDTFWRWRTPGWRMWHLPAGEKRDPVTAKKLERMGARPGLPDLLIMSPSGIAHWLELKSRKGKPTVAQAEFFDMVAQGPMPHAIVTSVKDALNQLYAWGAVRASVSA